MNYTCHSGGARGSDACFAKVCVELDIKVVNHGFKGHLEQNLGVSVIHSEEELKEADVHLIEAGKRLKRKFPSPNAYINNLLRRNYLIIRDVPVVYAVAELEKEDTVKGGTGWGCAMAQNLGKTVYLYEQFFGRWMFSYFGNMFETVTAPPGLVEKFAGIGTRDLKNNGIMAINNLLKQKL